MHKTRTLINTIDKQNTGLVSFRSGMLMTRLTVNHPDPNVVAICDEKSVFGCSSSDGQLLLLQPQLQHLLCLSALLTRVPLFGLRSSPHQSQVGPQQENTSGGSTNGAD